MEPLAGAPLVALAAVVLAAMAWAFLTTERRVAWFVTAASLWAGAACFTLVAFVGSGDIAGVLLGWMLTVAGLLTAVLAVAVPRPVLNKERRPRTSPSTAGDRGSTGVAHARGRVPVAAPNAR